MLGDGLYMSHGTIPILMPTPDGSFLQFDADVVKADIKLLDGIVVLSRESLVVDNVENILDNRARGWKNAYRSSSTPHVRQIEHFLDPIQCIGSKTCSIAELKKNAPSVLRSFRQQALQLVEKNRPRQDQRESLDMLSQISASCCTCSVHSPRPLSFHVSFPKGECVLNHDLALHSMWLDGQPFLHVVDKHVCVHTHFSAAKFLPGKSTKDVCNAFIMCWATTV